MAADHQPRRRTTPLKAMLASNESNKSTNTSCIVIIPTLPLFQQKPHFGTPLHALHVMNMQISAEFQSEKCWFETRSRRKSRFKKSQKHHTIGNSEVLPWTGWTLLTHPFNIAGSSVAALAARLSSNGPSVGLQLVGGQDSDVAALSFCRECEWRAGSAVPHGRSSGLADEFEQEGLANPTQGQTERNSTLR